MDFIKENPMIGSSYHIKVNVDIKSEGEFEGTVELTYAPDLSIMDNLVLAETIRAIVEDLESEEESIKIIGDTLVELLKPFALYIKMKLDYPNEYYKVEIDYEFNKAERYKIRRD